METFIGAASLVTAILSLWTRATKVELSTAGAAIRSGLEVVSLAVTFIVLGWLGLALAVAGALLGFAGWGLWSAIREDGILRHAAAAGGHAPEEMKPLARRVRRGNRVFRAWRHAEIAELIRLLSERGRSIEEIEDMATPVALLWTAHYPRLHPNLDTDSDALASLVERFDRLLRLSKTPVREAMARADVLTAGARHSAATFDEMLDGMVTYCDHSSASIAPCPRPSPMPRSR